MGRHVVFTRDHKIVVANVMQEWLIEAEVDGLGPRLYKLRNSVLDDLAWRRD